MCTWPRVRRLNGCDPSVESPEAEFRASLLHLARSLGWLRAVVQNPEADLQWVIACDSSGGASSQFGERLRSRLGLGLGLSWSQSHLAWLRARREETTQNWPRSNWPQPEQIWVVIGLVDSASFGVWRPRREPRDWPRFYRVAGTFAQNSTRPSSLGLDDDPTSRLANHSHAEPIANRLAQSRKADSIHVSRHNFGLIHHPLVGP